MISVGVLTAELRSHETEIATNALQYLDEHAVQLEQTFRLEVEKRPIIRFFDRNNFDGLDWGHYHDDIDTICLRLSSPSQWVNERVGDAGIVLVHEYTHFLVDRRATWAGDGRVPRWLNEGIAGYYAHEWMGALKGESLVSIGELADAPDRLLYEESFMLVRYLMVTHGEEKVLALVDACGGRAKDPLNSVLQIDEDELVRQLRASLTR